MKKYLLILSVGLILFASCAKQMDDEPLHSDSARVADSLLKVQLSAISKEKLTGIWVRPIATQPGDEGYHLYADGKLKFINMYSMIGDSWELRGDTLMLYAHTERYPTPVPIIFRVAMVTDSLLELVPENAEPGYTQKFRRKNFTLPERFGHFFHKEFQGRILPSQTYDHTFNVTSYFDGGIRIESPSPDVKFTVNMDGNELTDKQVREYKGSFPPGKYRLTVRYILPQKKRSTVQPYTIIVDEEEIMK